MKYDIHDPRYEREMEEFAKMNEGIRDIDWYKAQAEASQNGQTAAMDFAEAKKAEALAWRSKYNEAADELVGLKKDLDKLMDWFVWAVFFIVILLGLLIGEWLY